MRRRRRADRAVPGPVPPSHLSPLRPRPAAHAPATGAVVVPGPGPNDWVWPWWLQRQVDPASAAWQPADLVGFNRTGRNWTVIGIPEGEDRWVVDRCGLMAPSSGRWALDWWVGAEDRWRLPSAEPSVRQRLLDDAPVLETALRVPGGEVVARHWVVPGAGADLVVVEIDNRSAAPVAVGLSLRPVGPSGPTGVGTVGIDGKDMTVDGLTVVHADVAPRQSVVSDLSGGDVAATVLANATPAALDAEVTCSSGWASAAMVWPLPHRSSLRVEVPGAPRSRRPPRDPRGTAPVPDTAPGRGTPPVTGISPARRAPGGGPAPVPGLTDGAARPGPARPGPEATARGWSARTTRRTRLELPAGPLAAALEAQRRHLLLAITGGDDQTRVERAQVVAALSTAGLREEAAAHLDAWLDDQHRGGLLGRDESETAATLWALEVWARTGDDDGLVARSPLTVARAVERLARTAPAADPVAATWNLAGIEAGTRLLAQLGETEAAARAQRWGRARADELFSSLAGASEPDTFDRVAEAALLAVGLRVLPPGHPIARAGRDVARRPFPGVPAGAVAGPWPLVGFRPALSLALATSAALAGEDPSEALRWVVSVGSPTWTWPTVVAPRLGTGSHGSGHDPVVAAALWACGRALLVEDLVLGGPERGPAGVGIVTALPADWIGVGFEVHGLATAVGSLAYAVRWHADRPALLWEIDGTGPSPLVTARGLDPAWRGGGWRGEALLAVVPGPGRPGPPRP